MDPRKLHLDQQTVKSLLSRIMLKHNSGSIRAYAGIIKSCWSIIIIVTVQGQT